MSLRRLVDVFSTLRGNSALARVEVAFLLATMVEWAGWLALVVYAFGRGGAGEAGLIGFAVGLPAILVAPVAAILGDRHPRSRVMLGAYLGQALAFAAAAAAFALDAALAGYGLGIVAMALVALTRPLLASILPEIARSPDELTAGNVASGLGEGFGALGGSLAAGVLLAVGGAPAVLVAGAGAMSVASLLVLRLAIEARVVERAAIRMAEADLSGVVRVALHELGAGAAAMIADRRLVALSTLMAVTIGTLGALNVLIVIVAIDVLGFDEEAAGYLAAVTGVGALLGSLAATSLIGRERIAAPMLVSIVGFAIAVGAVGLGSTVVPVAIALVVTGIGWSVAWVAATTMIQRLVGDDVMTRVFGVNESLQTGAEALGGLVVPILVVAVGPHGALLALGGFLAVAALVFAPMLLRADRIDPAILRDVAIVRAVPMFMPLSAPVIERLAAYAEHSTAATGSPIVREGDAGDRFYIVIDGRVRVSSGGRDARELGAGASFGEIALLRDVPRTATVEAVEPTELLAIRREPFLEALTGQARSRAVAADVVEEYLAADRAAG
ncbi:MAG TPA: MFS transporter [Candidatus Limnocylindrales bacterium]|nr:MFS transporter [Candidatus Limnocylindrales bacterium]